MTDSPPRPPETVGGRALPVPFRRFPELYRAGRFWDSHEALEDAWRANRSDFYQGLILYASAWGHRERRNAHGVRAQLRKAVAPEELESVSPHVFDGGGVHAFVNNLLGEDPTAGELVYTRRAGSLGSTATAGTELRDPRHPELLRGAESGGAGLRGRWARKRPWSADEVSGGRAGILSLLVPGRIWRS